jgi:lipid-A-disaccharide synthase
MATDAARPLRIALVAGEASGDLLGEGLVAGLRARLPGCEIAGIAGPRMRAAGVDAWWDAGELSVMGIAEVLRHLPRLLRLRRRLVARVRAWRPDVYVGIDAPDFNLGVERRLRDTGIRTVHYVSPSVWAWRESRAAKIGRAADHVLCLFPMEPPIYARHGVDARFVGHPLARAFAALPQASDARAALGLPADAEVLAVLPGSRRGEIARLAPPFLAAARTLLAARPQLVVAVPAADAGCRAGIESAARALGVDPVGDPRLKIIDGRSHELLAAADGVLLASGTAALEAMLAERPMVVGYRIAPLTHWIVMRFGLMRTTRYSLPNILAGSDLVPELMQDDCTPERLAAAVVTMLDAVDGHAALRAGYREINQTLRGDSDHDAAAVIAGILDGTRTDAR